MVRNSKRRAFTIVELVIVIAVIAILAAVMIPTFGGVIESANVSADKQILPTVNSQIAIYTGLGNKIETEADLWKALKGDFNGGSDMTAKFDPRSAKNGYHYWYNVAKQEVQLLQYDAETGFADSLNAKRMIVRADSVARDASSAFAQASPRSFVEGFYFLDKSGNDFATFFNYVENLSASGSDYVTEYNQNLAAATGGNKANEALAGELTKKMAETVILTDKPAIVGSAANISYVYIPANNTADKENYYLSHEGTASIAANVTVTIEIPVDVKLGDGCLDAFGAIEVKVDIDTIKDLETVFSGSAVSVQATIVVNNTEYKVDGKDVYYKDDTKEDGKGGKVEDVELGYRNQVTGFTPIANGNVVSSCIAVDKAMNQTAKIDLNLLAQEGSISFTSNDLPKYDKIVWTVEETYKNVVEIVDGKVSFTSDFKKESINAEGTITFIGTPLAAKDSDSIKEITLKFVTLSDATVDFVNTGSTPITTTLANIAKVDGFMINFNGTANALFNNIDEFVYVAKDGTKLSGEAIETLGCADTHTLEVTTTANYFSIAEDKYTLTFAAETIKGLKGRMDTQTATVTIKNSNAKDAISGVATIKISDNQGSPFAVENAITQYKNYVYKVGDDNAITLDLLFEEIAATVGSGNLSQYKVLICEDEPTPDDNRYYPISNTDKHVIALDGKDWKTIELTADSFKDAVGNTTGERWVVVVANVADDNGGVVADSKTLAYAKIEVVDGLNIFEGEESKFINSTPNNNGTTDKTNDDKIDVTNGNQSIVLHSKLVFKGYSAGNCARSLQGANIWGNYYTIEAKDFKDTDRNTHNGYGFIHVSGGNNTINQLIIDGPVYAAPATSATNLIDNQQVASALGDFNTNQYGNFCNGINVGSNLTINDSYIFGFNSTVRVNGGQFVANRTVFEGGAWSNIFIANATKFQLNDCKTIQDHNGYTATIDNTSAKVLGFGIYVHDTMNNQSTKLTLELNNTKQYNWLSEADKSNGGLLFEYAMGEIFGESGIAQGQQFFHQTKYVNVTIASMGARLDGIIDKELTAYTDNYEVGGSTGSQYTAQKADEETKITVLNLLFVKQYAYVKANVYSYQHSDSCGCATEVEFASTYSIDNFLAARK